MKLRKYAGLFVLLANSSLMAQSAGTPGYSFRSFDYPGAGFTSGRGINESGLVVGDYSDNTGRHAFMGDNPPLNIDPPGTNFFTGSAAHGINNAGQVVGEYGHVLDPFDSAIYGFIRDPNGTYTSIQIPGAGITGVTRAIAINNNTQVLLTGTALPDSSVAVCTLPVGPDCFADVPLPITGNIQNVIPFGFNSSRTIVGQYVDKPPLRYNVHGFIGANSYDATAALCGGELFNQVTGIDDKGDIVGNYLDANCIGHGFVKLKNGMFITIDPKGSTYTEAWGISNNGQITGWYDDENFLSHAYIATPQQKSCQVDVPHSWQQGDLSWGRHAYNQSYKTKDGTALSTKMELTDGTESCTITGVNNLNGLREFINNQCRNVWLGGGITAAGPRTGEPYVSVYNDRCLYMDCYPRFNNTLKLRTVPGNDSTNILISKTLGEKGCALTSLAMALDFAKANAIPTIPFSSPVSLDPNSLNDFMSNTLSGLPFIGGAFAEDGSVMFPDTTDFMSVHTGNINLDFDAFQFNSLYEQDAAYKALDNALCSPDPHPVIVGVKLGLDASTNRLSAPNHYVLVTGKLSTADPYVPDRTQYKIEDPARSCSLISCTLDDYLAAIPALPQPAFVTRGFVHDPIGNRSKLNISSGEIVEILLQDQSGLRTGFDLQTNTDLSEIPRSVYFRDALEDDVTAEPFGTTTRALYTSAPEPGNYTIVVMGLDVGTYRLVLRAYSQDGSAQPVLPILGLAGIGSSSSFQIQFDSSPGATTHVTRLATFDSIASDVRVSLQLGMIDKRGIANSLLQKIRAAQTADSPARNHILRAFTNEVNAHTGKHITGIAPQVLLEDAASLAK